MNIRKVRRIVKASLGLPLNLAPINQPLLNLQSLIAQQNVLKKQQQSKIFNVGNITQALGDAASMFSNFIPELQNTTSLMRGINSGVDLVANVASLFGPAGQMLSGALKLGNMMGKGLQAMGIGTTDNMTKMDLILGSNIMALNPLSWINSGFGQTTQSFSKDNEVWEKGGSDYGGAMDLTNDAVSKLNKKYGLFSLKEKRKADDTISKAKILQNAVSQIMDESNIRKDLSRNNSLLRSTSYLQKLNGGPKQVRSSLKGGTLDSKLSKVKGRNYLKKLPTWEPTISLEIPDRSIEELIVEAKNQNPRFIQRMSEPVRYIKINKKDEQGNDYWESATHLMSNRDNKVYSLVQEIDGKLQLLNDDEAFDRANSTGNILTFKTDSEAKTFAENNYKKGWPEFFNSPLEQGEMESEINMFKDGGKLNKEEELKEEQKNVIPEGALHKNKHHMEDSEGLTKKGIPVVDNEGELQAEIEKEEIIFTLEVTKQLEELLDQYNKEENKSKLDEIAISAGKLLVEQILYNTDDRANLIERVE